MFLARRSPLIHALTRYSPTDGSVHHWDENGLADPSAEPPFIHDIHQQEIAFVKAWLKDFKAPA